MNAHRILVLAVGPLLLLGCSTPAAPASSATSTPAVVATPTPSAVSPSAAATAVPSGRSGQPRGSVTLNPAGSDPAAVAAAVVLTQWTWDTAIDNSPQDAWRRARPWLSKAAASRADVLTSGGGAQWTDLAARDGWTTAEVAPLPELEIADTADAAGRVYEVTVTPRSGSGQQLTPFALTAAVALVLEDGQWRVDQVVSTPGAAP